MLRLSSECFLCQIVQNVALISARLLEQRDRISVLWEGKTKQLQAHEPTFCACRDLLDGLIRHLDPHHHLEDVSGLLSCTAQLVCTHFEQMLVAPQLRERQGRISSC